MALGRELLRLTLGQEDMGTRSRSTLRCSSLAANIARTSQVKWLGVSMPLASARAVDGSADVADPSN